MESKDGGKRSGKTGREEKKEVKIEKEKEKGKGKEESFIL